MSALALLAVASGAHPLHGAKVSLMLRMAPDVGSGPIGPDRRAPCAGIRYDLQLFDGDGYFLRSTYLLDGHDASHHEIGAWPLDSR